MQNLQLSIAEPCHENWQQMTPTDQGRFCNACAKEVIDFSAMTDIQVLNYFTNLTHEKVCGRALPEQLDRTISRPLEPKKRLFWYWNYIVMFFMFFTKSNNAAAQSCTKPATELTPVNNSNLRGEMIVVDELKKNASRVITGKVIDNDGNPVSFASIRIKGLNTGVAADAKGVYAVKVKPNTILIISAAGFKVAEVTVGLQTEVNTVMEKNRNSSFNGEIVVLVGGMGFRNSDEYYGPEDKLNNVAVLAVKDELSGKAIENAKVVITKNSTTDFVLTDKKGVYKLKGIKKYEEYFIKVIADGYEANEFTIDANDIKDRKKEWEVLLRKEKLNDKRQTDINNALAGRVPGIQVRSKSATNLGKETQIRVGGVVAIDTSNKPIYVVDGIKMPPETDINTDDVEDISFLLGPAASALFGSAGANGAIVVTTTKTKEKKLDTVTVNAQYGIKRSRRMGATSVTVCNIDNVNYLTDTKVRIMTVLTDSLKVYPNPVNCNSTFSISLKLKEAGAYQMQFSDATGRVVLQKQFNATAKKQTETVLTQNWAAGIYYVRVFNKSKLISKSSFIVQN